MPWPCPSPACPLAGAFSSQSLPWLLGRFLHGWSRSLVLPWKFSRLILFSTASRTPHVPETDGDGLILGSFSLQEGKRKVLVRGLAAAAESWVLRCWARSPAQESWVWVPSPPEHPRVKAAGDVSHSQKRACVVWTPRSPSCPRATLHGCLGDLPASLTASCKGVQPRLGLNCCQPGVQFRARP